MANRSLAVLESALRARKLDRTLTTALPPLERTDPSSVLPTEIASLDASLCGGLPRGQLSEIVGPRSSGRMTLALQICAAATRRGEIAAFIDTLDRLDVASVVATGIDLDRLLWVRGSGIGDQGSGARGSGSGTRDPGLGIRGLTGVRSSGLGSGTGTGLLERIVDRALKAFGLVLQAGGFGMVGLDLADVPLVALRRIPLTTWLRVQRTIEGSDTACVLIAPEPMARSAGGLTLALEGRTEWEGEADRSRRVVGLDLAVRVVSSRRWGDGVQGTKLKAQLQWAFLEP